MTKYDESKHGPSKWVLSIKDLPQKRGPARYRVKAIDGPDKVVTLEKRKRQVVDLLLNTSPFCASTVRLGDVVFPIKQDNGVHPKTVTAESGRKLYAFDKGDVVFVGEDQE